jgi:hypothetical protein
VDEKGCSDRRSVQARSGGLRMTAVMRTLGRLSYRSLSYLDRKSQPTLGMLHHRRASSSAPLASSLVTGP